MWASGEIIEELTMGTYPLAKMVQWYISNIEPEVNVAGDRGCFAAQVSELKPVTLYPLMSSCRLLGNLKRHRLRYISPALSI